MTGAGEPQPTVPATNEAGLPGPEHPAFPPGTRFEIWSCDPRDIPPWTEEAKARLQAALADIFGWPKETGAAPASPPQD